ncbi:hypothetical protein AVEN_166773-1 [Araneus ventricosus]|uniref:Uncharacterized protein n=1 Tax=Araneus ventricosus TaxID=182803 RepID=A0A4Y2BNB6_ARAVE|nr:hypothetical protein AVEN_166773-1 [Araneus ventricosus]
MPWATLTPDTPLCWCSVKVSESEIPANMSPPERVAVAWSQGPDPGAGGPQARIRRASGSGAHKTRRGQMPSRWCGATQPTPTQSTLLGLRH